MSAYFIKSQKRSRVSSFALFSLIILSLIASIVQPSLVEAQAADDLSSLENEVIKYQETGALVNCMQQVDSDRGNNEIKYSDAEAGLWFADKWTAFAGELSGGTDGTISCNDLVTKVTALAGYNSPIDMFCAFVPATKNGYATCTDPHANEFTFYPLDFEYRDANGDKQRGVYYSSKFLSNVAIGKMNLTGLSDAGKYYKYYKAFLSTNNCSASTAYTTAAGWDSAKIKDLTQTPSSGYSLIDKTYYYKDNIYGGYFPGDGQGAVNLRAIGSITSGSTYAGSHYVVGSNPSGGDEVYPAGEYEIGPGKKNIFDYGEPTLEDRGIHGGKDLYEDTGPLNYEFYDCNGLIESINKYGSAFYIWSQTKNIDISGFKQPTPTVDDTSVSSCAITGIGWIICPVVNFLAGIADGAFNFLSNSFLRTDPAIFDQTTGTYQGWLIMRDFANVAFVIAFLIIIFSQITSIGIGNYGIKKLLPRLIIAAVLVNLSYFVCQIAVDLSNILGYSIKDTFDGFSSSFKVASDFGSLSSGTTGSGAAGVFGGLATTLLVVGVAAYAGLAAFIPILIGAVVALLTIFFILLARQALIILLIVIAPLAFVAFLLPNTQNLFKKWQKAFTAMLMLFPIVSVVFGASKFAGDILQSTFKAGLGTDDSWWGSVIASAVVTLPLFIVPGILKKSLDGIGGLGQAINNIGKKLSDSSKKAVEPYVQQKGEQRRAARAAGEIGLFGNKRDPNKTKENKRYQALKEEMAQGKRAGESTADWDNRRKGLLKGMTDISNKGDRFKTRQTLGQRMALGRAAREADISRLKKQPGEQLKALANDAEKINSLTGKSALEAKGYSRGTQRLATRAANIFEREELSDLKASTVESESKARFEDEHREGAIIESKAAEEALSVKQAETKQLVEEAKTEAGALKISHDPNSTVSGEVIGSLRGSSERARVSQSATEAAQRVGNQEYATRITNDTALATEAGGINPYGQEAEQARAVVVDDEGSTKEKQNARILLDEERLSGASLRTRAVDFSRSPGMRKAAIEKTVETNDIKGIAALMEDSHNWPGDEGVAMRLTLDAALQKAGNKPKFVGQGPLAFIRRGKATNPKKELLKTVVAGGYSPEAVATGDADELIFVARTLATATDSDPEIVELAAARTKDTGIATSPSEYLELARKTISDAAKLAKKDPRLNVRIQKNKAAIDHLDTRTDATTAEWDILDRPI